MKIYVRSVKTRILCMVISREGPQSLSSKCFPTAGIPLFGAHRLEKLRQVEKSGGGGRVREGVRGAAERRDTSKQRQTGKTKASVHATHRLTLPVLRARRGEVP